MLSDWLKLTVFSAFNRQSHLKWFILYLHTFTHSLGFNRITLTLLAPCFHQHVFTFLFSFFFFFSDRLRKFFVPYMYVFINSYVHSLIQILYLLDINK